MSVLKKEKTIKFSVNTIFFGLIVFYSGMYIFPDGGDISRVFYILVLLPTLYVLFSLDRSFFSNRIFWLLMLLPLYLTLSHFWADEENIIRSRFFHIKKTIYILLFISAVFYIFEKSPSFLRTLLQSLFVIGFISAIISILCFISSKCGITSGRLSGFSVQDINKAGAIYTIHMGLCAFFFFYGFFESKKDNIWLKGLMLVGFFVSGLAVIYAKTDATWVMLIIILFFSLIPKWYLKPTLTFFLVLFISMVMFFYFGGYELLMSDNSFAIRWDLAQSSLVPWFDNVLFGIGMTHKLPLTGFNIEYWQPHPHNIFIDVLRFGGIVGLLVLIITLLYLLVMGMKAANQSVLAKFCLAWFVSGIAIMTVYAQQPITRPGGYTWFLYWMPIALLAAEIAKHKKMERTIK